MKRLALVLALAVGSTGCAQVNKVIGNRASDMLDRGIKAASDRPVETIERVGKAGKKALEESELTPENEHYIGRTAAVKILAEHEYKYADSASIARNRLEGLTEYVNSVGALLTAHLSEGTWPLAGFHFIVLESPEVNAFSTPGGFIFVTSGALALMETEDELACVLSHEVVHVSRRHAAFALHTALFANAAINFAAEVAAKEPSEKLMELFNKAIERTIELAERAGYGHAVEYEADKEGAKLAIAAGYDSSAMASFLRKLPSTSDGGFLKAHPSSADRIEALASVKTASGTSSASGIAARKARFDKATKAITAHR